MPNKLQGNSVLSRFKYVIAPPLREEIGEPLAGSIIIPLMGQSLWKFYHEKIQSIASRLQIQLPQESFLLNSAQVFYDSEGDPTEVRLDLQVNPVITTEEGKRRSTFQLWSTESHPDFIMRYSGSISINTLDDNNLIEIPPEHQGKNHFTLLVLNYHEENSKVVCGGMAAIWNYRELEKRVTLLPVKTDAPAITPTYISVPNSPLYYNLQSAYAAKEFSTNSGKNLWPQANLHKGEDLRAYVELRPIDIEIDDIGELELAQYQQQMYKLMIDMGDETADTLSALSYVWLKKADNPESFAVISSYDILEMRGLKPRKGGGGRRGGYTQEQHKNIRRQVNILSNSWLVVDEMSIYEEESGKRKKANYQGESRVMNIDARFGQKTLSGTIEASWYKYKPGGALACFIFGPGRQTALISHKALHYNPYKQQWEKRLTRYLAWQWRIRLNKSNYLQPFSIKTLLDGIRETIDENKPPRTKERLEKALDTLQEDKIIMAWQYEEGWDEKAVGKRGWWKVWLETKVYIEPPQEIIEHYERNIDDQATMKALPPPSSDSINIKEERTRRGLTLLQTAEQIGISVGLLSTIERGGKVTTKTLKKIKKWFSKNESPVHAFRK